MYQPLDSNPRLGQLGSRSVSLPVAALATDRVAVIINKNAKQVDDRVAKKLAQKVPSADFFYSRTLEEAESFARHIVQRGYGTVLCGGGDGTLVNVVNHVCRYVEEANDWRIQRARHFGDVQSLLPYPEFGILKLGTGNGLSAVVGASAASLDLQKVLSGPRHPAVEVDMIEAEGQRFVFAGMGYDAWVLNDYVALKKWAQKNPLLKKLSGTAAAYLAAVVTRTVPAMLRQGSHKQVRVTSLAPGFYMDGRRGDKAIPVAAVQVLYEGPAGLVGVGTAPYYGFGFTMYPFAGMMPRMMQLRIGTISPIETLARLPSLWNGTLRCDTILDFMVSKVKIESEGDMPYQHSGDGMGHRREMTFSIAKQPLKLVDYRGAIV